MTTEYYNPSGSPSTGAAGSSAAMRSEFTAVQAGFALLPALSGNGALPVFVNAGGTALEASSASTARIRLGLGSISTQNANNVAITGGTVTGLSQLASNNAAITGGTITGVSQLGSNNASITGGTITGVSQFSSNNVSITGGSISTTGNVAFTDNAFAVVGSADATKKVRLEVDGVTSGATRVLTVADVDSAIGKQPTRTVLASGSGTYTTPVGATRLSVRSVGPGGGGAGSGTTATSGGNGGNTTFSTLTAGGGVGGNQFNPSGGGTASGGDINIVGSIGGAGNNITNSIQGGNGGAGPWGGQGSGGSPNVAGNAAAANSGAGGGGGGGGVGVISGAGGSSGGYVEKLITAPAATYSYGVGAAGTAGTAGTSGVVGGAGGSGYIVVDEYYN